MERSYLSGLWTNRKYFILLELDNLWTVGSNKYTEKQDDEAGK